MMVGIAWLVQVINYPMFKRIPVEFFRDYHQFHLKKAQLLIAPLMLIEMVSAAMLLIWPIIQVPYSLYAVNYIRPLA
ncbi:hypothetical protein PHSC3_000465 [Chlamydiales bacterium STE3]|nr:hypothetical protein PHSC3_000465 [Chlamydiales bacterium STE3]